MQGADAAAAEALGSGDLDRAPLPASERALLEFVRTVTQHAYRTGDAEVQRLRDHGWTDPQIAETVYITALFAFFNRVADAFGLEDPGYREVPPPASAAEQA